MKIIDVSRPPKEIWLGRDGENNWRPIAFECATWLAKRPDGIITVWMEANGSKFPISADMDGTKAVWYPQQEELFLGSSRIEVSIQSGDDVGTSAIIECHVDESLIGNGEHPEQTAPPWTVKVVADVTEQADRAEEASEHYPKIISGVWYVWSVSDEGFVSTGISAQGEDGFSPTVTVTAITGGHRVTITDASGDHTFDVMDGEGGTSADAVLYTPQTLTPAQQEQARENIGAGTYSKPASGIPASDLAAGVIPTVPQMATQADMSDWTSGKTVDAAVLKNGVQYIERMIAGKADASDIPTDNAELANGAGYQTEQDVQTAIAAAAELPSGGATGDFLRKTASGVAWETVPTYIGGSY